MFLYMIKACANCGGKVAYKMMPMEVNNDEDMMDLEAKAAGWNCLTPMRLCIQLEEETQMGVVMTSRFLTDEQLMSPNFGNMVTKLLGEGAMPFMGGVLLRIPNGQPSGKIKSEDINEKKTEFPFTIVKSDKIM